VFGSSHHHPLALVDATIFIVGLIYFIFIRNPQILNKYLGEEVGPVKGTSLTPHNVPSTTGPLEINYGKDP